MRESIAFSDCNQQKSNMHQHHLLSGSTTMHLNSCHACMHDCDQKQLCNRSCDCQESFRDSPCFWKNWMKFEILPTNEKDEDRISASENTNEKRNFTYFFFAEQTTWWKFGFSSTMPRQQNCLCPSLSLWMSARHMVYALFVHCPKSSLFLYLRIFSELCHHIDEMQINLMAGPWCRHMPNLIFRRRPYRVECTGSLLTSEVKQRRAWSVLGWGTAWEDLRVLSAFLSDFFCETNMIP